MEKHFKNKLKSHKVDWDKEDLLPGLKEELSNDKPASGWKYLFLLPLLFLATCWGLNFMNGTKDLSGVIVGEKVMELNDQRDQAYDFDNVPQAEIKEFDKEQDSSKIMIAESGAKEVRSKVQTLGDLKKWSTENTALQILRGNVIFENKKNASINNQSFVPSSRRLNEAIGKDVNRTADFVLLDSNNIEQQLSKLSNSIINNDGQLDAEDKIERIEKLSSIAVALINRKRKFEEVFKVKFVEEKDNLVSERQHNNILFMAVSGDVGLLGRSVMFESDNAEFVRRLETNEQTISSRALVATNINLGYQFESGWFLQSGLEYRENIEFFKYDHSKVETTQRFDEKALYFLNQNSDTLFFADSILVQETETRTVRHWNKHRFLIVPIDFGYRHAFGKVNIFGSAGLSYALLQNFQGRENILAEDGSNEIVNDPAFQFKNRVGFQVGLGLEYSVSGNSNLFAKINYRKSPKLVEGVKTQWHQSCSLGLGFRYFICK